MKIGETFGKISHTNELGIKAEAQDARIQVWWTSNIPLKMNGRKGVLVQTFLICDLEIIQIFLLIMCLRFTKHKEITHYLQLQLEREGTIIDVN